MARYSSSRYRSSRSSSRPSSRYNYRDYGYGGFGPYVSVAEKRQRAEQAARELGKSGRALHPIEVAGREICHTWWGLSWCRNLEYFGDYANRLPRGRSYVRCGAVIDLQIGEGVVRGLVQGSSLYKVEIRIKALAADRRQDLCDRCAADIGSTIDLLSGRLDRNIMNILAEPKRGLFPEPRDIDFQCSCPDHASVCKHVAAVLYGIGVRFDANPELFFTLRGIDPTAFAAAATTAGLDVPVAGAGVGPAPDTLAGASVQELGAVFGIELSTRSAAGTAATGTAATGTSAAGSGRSDAPARSAPAAVSSGTGGRRAAAGSGGANVPAQGPGSGRSRTPAMPVPGAIDPKAAGRPGSTAAGFESAAPGAAAAGAPRAAVPPAPGSGFAPMPKEPVREPSPVEAFVASLFDPITGRPVDVEAPAPHAPARPAGKGALPTACRAGTAAPPATARGSGMPTRLPLKRVVEKLRRSAGTVAANPATGSPVVPLSPKAGETTGKAPASPAARPSGPGKAATRPSTTDRPAPAGRQPPPPAVRSTTRPTNLPTAPRAKAKAPATARSTSRSTNRPANPRAKAKAPATARSTARPTPRRAAAPARPKPAPSPAAAPSRKILDLCQPRRLLKMADLRALGIPYAAVQRALDTGHLEITGWRGEYTTTRTTADWLRSRGLL
ncbi:MAG: hypothetical protein GX442_24540 [Candidatus Riflebacteria bacterium]|nr:hypothetical protein [Candidatus Riflebacteria bacterium]